MLHEEADDSRGTGRGQLPVRRELGTADRFVVGMAFNSDVIRSEFWRLEPVQQAFQDGLAESLKCAAPLAKKAVLLN